MSVITAGKTTGHYTPCTSGLVGCGRQDTGNRLPNSDYKQRIPATRQSCRPEPQPRQPERQSCRPELGRRASNPSHLSGYRQASTQRVRLPHTGLRQFDGLRSLAMWLAERWQGVYANPGLLEI